MALGHIQHRFAWQAWRLWHWAGSGGALGPVLVAGDAAALCVAGLALGHIHLGLVWQAWHLWHWAGPGGVLGFWSPVTPRHFPWQAWHLVTSTIVLRSRHGTWSHPPSFCVAGVGTYGTGLALVARLGRICQHHLLHTLSHIIFHTQLCHPPSLTHHLSHTTFSHTIFHTPSLTHYFVTPSFTHHP